jgi:ribulose-5-phosphate 4-epimerase/fuculose-1-phosphate aldolase
MKNASKEMVDSFVRACQQAAGCGLMRCSSGNLSVRIDGGLLLVKTSRSWMARVGPADVSLCKIADGSLLEGRKPSVEIGFHAGILRTRSDVNVVMHFQTPCATALACRRSESINYFVIPEIPFYVGSIARIPYLPPGSKELARAVTKAMRNHDMVVMGNHGQVTVARDVDHAIQNAVFFELASEIILRCGADLQPLPEAEAQALLQLRQSASGGA